MNKIVLLSTIIFSLVLISEINGQTIDRGPYLQLVTTGSIYVKWRTNTATTSKVWFGSSPGSLNTMVSSGNSTTEHELQITGLTANTTYYYAVGYGNTQLAGGDSDHYFKTAPPTNTNQTIKAWVLGNAGHKNNNQRAVRDAYYDYIGNDHIDLMLLLGDNAYDNGTDADYQLSWFENMYEDRLINSVMWSCFGNHDGDSADSQTETGPYYDIFTFPRNGEAGGIPSGTEAYYSFDYGNIHFISLNTWDISLDVGDPMMDWLQDDLNGTSQDWIVALCHHPPYTGTGNNESDNHATEKIIREDFIPILEAAGVDLVLSSHHHSYQRSFLINGHYDVSSTWNANTMGVDLGDGRLDGDDAYYKEINGTGTVYMVAGSAGDLGSDPSGYPAMYSAIHERGSVALEVTDLQMDVKFIDENDNIGDYFTIIKQINPPTVNITSPTNGYFYNSSPGTITINVTASDNIGNPSVEFFINGTSIGTDFSPPYNRNWTNPSNGNYEIKVKATDGDGNVSTSKIKVRVGDGAICSQINKSANDAEEDDSGSVSTTNSDLELVNDGTNQIVGLKFENLNIPPGAVITDAYIQFTADETNNINPRKLEIFAQDSDYPTSFGNNDYNISSRAKTSASVNWYPEFWNSAGQSGPNQKTIQIRSVIQEVVDRSGFTMDSPIVIIIEGYGKRVAESYDGDAPDAAELCIEFSNCPDSDGDGTCDDDDICAGLEPGDPCNDGNSGTFNDLIQGDCSCEGTPYDCPLLQGDIGDPCNDNDSATYDDQITAACVCAGTPYDCYPNPFDIGDPCNDGDTGTYNDVYGANCICAGTPYDCYPNPVGIGDPCNDGNPGTYNDAYDSNCVCLGTSFDCPGLQADFGEPCNDGNSNTYNDEITTSCTCEGITPSGTQTLTSAFVGVGSDDAEQNKSNNSISLTSSDLEMMVDGSTAQLVGIRFTNLNIPQGMYITSAMIQFSADAVNNQNPCNIEIYGQAIDNAPTFAATNNNIGSRTKTSAKVNWTPDNWISSNDRGPAQRTVNIAPVIQEIVDRPGFTSGSAIAVILDGVGNRRAFSFNGDASKAAQMVIIYDLVGPLPVELLDITAKTQENGIKVDWSTASETNNDYFTVERSMDGRSFQPIGTVKGKGTTTELSNYTFLDKDPENGLNYYRLKQTDFDGQYSYSRVVSANFQEEASFQVYPTVAENKIFVRKNGNFYGSSTLKIHDITGRSFKLAEIAEDEFEKELSVEELIPGVYYVSIYNNESVETFKIIKL